MKAIPRKTALTKTFIKQVQPGSKAVVVWDEKVPGLFLKVLPSGRKVFGCYFRVQNGKQRRPSLGEFGVLTLDKARQLAKKLLLQVAGGSDPTAERKKQKQGAVTLADFSARYLSDYARPHKKASSVRNDQWLLKNHILPALGRKPLNAITKGDIVRLHAKMKSTPYNANRAVDLLSCLFNLAREWGALPETSVNPARGVRRYKEPPRKRYLDNAELHRLAEALINLVEEGRISRAVADIVRLLALTGARRGEILNLQWNEVDLPQCCLNLRDSKTGAKTIILNSPAIAILERQQATRQRCRYVFESERRPGQPWNNINKQWNLIRQRAQLADVRLHDLRHCYASVAVGLQMGLPVIGSLLGHKQVATTQRYGHLQTDTLRLASEAIGAALEKAMQGGGPLDPEPGPARVLDIKRAAGEK